MWQTAYVSSYVRNGPILNGALCGLDEACGTSRRSGPGCRCMSFWRQEPFCDCDVLPRRRKTVEETSENVSKFVELGWKHVRIQLGGYGSPSLGTTPDFKGADLACRDGYQENQAYVAGTLKLFEHVRKINGGTVELIHDMHEVSSYRGGQFGEGAAAVPLFFAEDPLSPEQNGLLQNDSEQCSTPSPWASCLAIRWNGPV